MKKLGYLALSILEMSKIVIYECLYDYAKPKFGEKTKISFMDIDSFILCIQNKAIHADIEKDVETRFDTSNCELERPLPKKETLSD